MKTIKTFTWFLLSLLTIGLSACSNDDDDDYKTFSVTVQLVYPDGLAPETQAGITVSATSAATGTSEATTDATGTALFTLPAGAYEFSASTQLAAEGYAYALNGIASGITVSDNWDATQVIKINLVASKSGQIIIKELYTSACPKDDGSGNYNYGKYVTLYNNSAVEASVDNLCLAFALPVNSSAANNNYNENGELSYKAEGFIPAGYGVWYYPQALTLAPGQEAVIAIDGAIDNTTSYSQCVDLSHADYACYDIEDWSLAAAYPAPSVNIPSSRYFTAEKWSQGTAWPISVSSPAFFIFVPQGTTPAAWAADANNNFYNGGTQTLPYLCKKVPNEWILDAVEVYDEAKPDKNVKRLTADLDAGSISMTSKLGHTLYRNVDKTATEALPENEGKLVTGYTLGNDASGIDAEASLAAGARIIFLDSNNSTNDFHQRSQQALRK